MSPLAASAGRLRAAASRERAEPTSSTRPSDFDDLPF